MKFTPMFLRRFLQFSGILEMIIALGFFSLKFFQALLPFDLGIPLFYLFSAVTFFILGFLLWYSARDVERYRMVIYASCAFRYLMIIPELSTMLVLPAFIPVLVAGLLYDYLSSTFTLWLLKNVSPVHGN